MKSPRIASLLGSAALIASLLSFGLTTEATSVPAKSIVREAHTVSVPGGSIQAWEVRLVEADDLAPKARPVVIFLHGGTWSGRPNFDLRFEDYSTMEHFARQGWDTFAVDARGYGSSSDPEGENWSEAADVVKDLHLVVQYISKLRSVGKVDLVGWSWGSQVAALYAQEHPQHTGRVVLYGTRWQPYEGAPDAPQERFRATTLEDAKADFIDGCCDPTLVEAYAKAAFAADPESPNGVFRDYFENLPIIAPAALTVPTLIIAGEHEAATSMGDIAALFQALATTDKQLAVIPGGGHAVHLEKGRHRWRSTVLSFLREVEQ